MRILCLLLVLCQLMFFVSLKSTKLSQLSKSNLKIDISLKKNTPKSSLGTQNKIKKEGNPVDEDIDAAVKHGLDEVENLVSFKEPNWFKMGLFLDKYHPASKVAEFGKPNKKALKFTYFGLATLEATKQLIQTYPKNVSRALSQFPNAIKSRILEADCPLKGRPKCPLSSKKYRTYDGVCNNLLDTWKGAAMLPMQRFLPPTYEDGIQSIRRSILGSRLPSPREISTKVHKDKNDELNVVTLMFMQWGQFIDHDVTSVVKSRSFNGSVPRCCSRDGSKSLPLEFLHPSCLPIEVPEDDNFFEKFGVGCMEFIRSAPSTRINCDLGWREQINQVTSFIDASMIYGSDIETAESIRTFRNGKIQYGRPRGNRPLQPPDPPGGELCTAGALTTDCFHPGDGRVAEQPGLTAIHTVWIRYHNQIASKLARANTHWSDEKIYQETRKIVYSLIQHITYNEFLPILLGPEVISLFELELTNTGFYEGYNPKVDPAIANSFSTAAYRFGHSMVQNSFVRSDEKHRPIFNNVSLHNEFRNLENIWSFGSVDRTILGFCNQPSQRRDVFICDELSNHLFQPFNMPFGMDLSSINIQRGRDHGIPPYTFWREPCGLTAVQDWEDLAKVFSASAIKKFQKVYRHVDDIDLFSGGLAEKPVRGAVVGPTFACIIAQQFINLRKGDRFWYENGNLPSSFTPAQLQQLRRITFSNILCHTMDEIQTIQPFVFLSADSNKNSRLLCTDPILKKIDLTPWIEADPNEIEDRAMSRESVDIFNDLLSNNKRTTQLKYKRKNKPAIFVNHTNNIILQNRDINDKRSSTPPVEVNIKIQYYPSQEPTTPALSSNKQKYPNPDNFDDKPVSYPVFVHSQETYNSPPNIRPTFIVTKPPYNTPYDPYEYRPTQMYNRPSADVYDSPVYKPNGYNDYDEVIFEDRPFSLSKKPYKPITNHYLYSNVYTTEKPIENNYDQDISGSFYKKYTSLKTNEKDQQFNSKITVPTKIYSKGSVHRVDGPDIDGKLDFKSRLVNRNKNDKIDKNFVKISSIKSHATVSSNSAIINTVLQREGDAEILEEDDEEDVISLVEMDVVPSDISDENWLIYNENSDAYTRLVMPTIESVAICSQEIPQPIKDWKSIKN